MIGQVWTGKTRASNSNPTVKHPPEEVGEAEMWRSVACHEGLSVHEGWIVSGYLRSCGPSRVTRNPSNVVNRLDSTLTSPLTTVRPQHSAFDAQAEEWRVSLLHGKRVESGKVRNNAVGAISVCGRSNQELRVLEVPKLALACLLDP